jgi:hypothetical protein
LAGDAEVSADLGQRHTLRPELSDFLQSLGSERGWLLGTRSDPAGLETVADRLIVDAVLLLKGGRGGASEVLIDELVPEGCGKPALDLAGLAYTG